MFLINSQGQVVKNIDTLDHDKINLSHLDQGIYFFKFIIKNQVIVKRVVIGID